MFDIFEQIRSTFKTSSVRIDSNVFSYHYRLTVLILIACSLIIGTRKYFGDPIDCTASVPDKTERIVDNYCWFKSYIVVPRDPDGSYDSLENHGFRPVISSLTLEDIQNPDSQFKPYYLHAYQWIEFILFLQAVLFFVPRYLWRYCWEQGRVKALSEGFTLVAVKEGGDEDRDKYLDVVRYIRRHKFSHVEYAWKYIACEVLNFANVLTQFCLLKSLMGINLTTLLEDFFSSYSNENSEHLLNLIFPKLVRCDVPTGTGASHVEIPELCVLPGNVFTTKIYIYLWFHFAGLTIITGISLIYRLATIVSAQFRCFLMKRAAVGITKDCTRAVSKLGYAEWFLLTLVGKNMDPFSFNALLKEYGYSMTESRPSFSILGNDLMFSTTALNNISKESQK